MDKIKAYESQEIKQIEQKSNDEIQYESNLILAQARAQSEEDLKKKQTGLQIEHKIKRSRKINECRLSKMKVRFEMIEKMQKEVKDKLIKMT